MPRHTPHLYLVGPWSGSRIGLEGEARRHLAKVLRIEPGSDVTYTDGAGRMGAGVFDGDVIERGSERMLIRESALAVAVAPPKNSSRLRFVVEKLAELGVARLVWLATEYSEGRPPRPEKAMAWSKAALQQSRGSWLMDISGPVTVGELDGFGVPIFADHGGGSVDDLRLVADPVLCVGPEGGFAADEIPDDAICLALGTTILRVETAAVVGAALLGNGLRNNAWIDDGGLR